jgi:hypothetical protein
MLKLIVILSYNSIMHSSAGFYISILGVEDTQKPAESRIIELCICIYVCMYMYVVRQRPCESVTTAANTPAIV